MDGFINAFRQVGKTGTSVMGYYTEPDIQYYWNLADEYLLFDHFFSAAAAGSVTNHMYWVAAAPGTTNDQLPDAGWGDLAHHLRPVTGAGRLLEILRAELRSQPDIPAPGAWAARHADCTRPAAGL